MKCTDPSEKPALMRRLIDEGDVAVPERAMWRLWRTPDSAPSPAPGAYAEKQTACGPHSGVLNRATRMLRVSRRGLYPCAACGAIMAPESRYPDLDGGLRLSVGG